MKNKISLLMLFMVFITFATPAGAVWQGKLDLDVVHNPPSPMFARELHDGQYLAGLTRAFWYLNRNDVEMLHVGAFQAWNAEHGNPSTGLAIGRNMSIGKVLGALADITYLSDAWKPVALIGAVVSIDAFGGYRPQHTTDVQGSWIYGFFARLDIPFSTDDLKKHW